IVFGADRYTPGTSHGRKLLAHELTHVLQQGGVKTSLQKQREAFAEDGNSSVTEIIRLVDASLGVLTRTRSRKGRTNRVVPNYDTAVSDLESARMQLVEVRSSASLNKKQTIVAQFRNLLEARGLMRTEAPLPIIQKRSTEPLYPPQDLLEREADTISDE